VEEDIMTVVTDVAATTDTIPHIVSAGLGSHWRQASGSIPLYGAWHVGAITKVFRVAGLPNNWDSYGSQSPTSKALDRAIGLVTYVAAAGLEDLIPTPSVYPVSGGGIRLEWQDNAKELALEVLPNGLVEFFQAQGNCALHEGQLVSDQIPALLEWLTIT
jgi:hypothetical protein